jgi:hypothetical protein
MWLAWRLACNQAALRWTGAGCAAGQAGGPQPGHQIRCAGRGLLFAERNSCAVQLRVARRCLLSLLAVHLTPNLDRPHCCSCCIVDALSRGVCRGCMQACGGSAMRRGSRSSTARTTWCSCSTCTWAAAPSPTRTSAGTSPTPTSSACGSEVRLWSSMTPKYGSSITNPAHKRGLNVSSVAHGSASQRCCDDQPRGCWLHACRRDTS